MSMQSKVDRLIEKILVSDPSLWTEIDNYKDCFECVGTNGFTPLMVAAGEGLTEAFELLVSRGAQLSTSGYCGLTPLHEAACSGRMQIAKRLIELGANVDALSVDEATPLMCAAAWGYMEMAEFLLECGADPWKTTIYGYMASDIARQKCEDAIAEMLDNKTKTGE